MLFPDMVVKSSVITAEILTHTYTRHYIYVNTVSTIPL